MASPSSAPSAAPEKASKSDASYVFWPETEYRCSDQCTQLHSPDICCKFGELDKIDADAGSCDYYEHGGATSWNSPVTGLLTKSAAGYSENSAKVGFGCKRCEYFDPASLDCTRVDKDSQGFTPGMIHPNACCNFESLDATRGSLTREELVDYFESRGNSQAASLTRGDYTIDLKRRQLQLLSL